MRSVLLVLLLLIPVVVPELGAQTSSRAPVQTIEGPPLAFTRITVGLSGQLSNGDSETPSMSANGRFVTYSSAASNLVAGDTNGMADVFVYDRTTAQTTRESVTSSGAEANDGSGRPLISDDGRYVAFISYATNLAAGTERTSHIYVRDRALGTTTLVDRTLSGAVDNASYPFDFSMSDDGRYLAFDSSSDSLVSGDSNGCKDVFVRDVFLGVADRISLDASVCSTRPRPSISGDGRYVAFSGEVRGSAPDRPNNGIFVRDRLAGLTSHESNESEAFLDWSIWPSISADGRLLVWYRTANYVAGASGMYVRDRLDGRTLGPIVTRPGEDWIFPYAPRTQSYVSYISRLGGAFPAAAPEAYLFEAATQTFIRVSPGSTVDGVYDVSPVAGDAFSFASKYAFQPTPTNYTRDIYLVTLPPGFPGPPTNLAWSISGATVTLTWAPPASGAPPSEYVIAAGPEPGRTDDAIIATGSTSTTFSATVPANGTFFVRIHARNAVGTGGPSGEIRVTLGSGRRQ